VLINQNDNNRLLLVYIQCLGMTVPSWGHQETLYTETTRMSSDTSHQAPQHLRLHRNTSFTISSSIVVVIAVILCHQFGMLYMITLEIPPFPLMFSNVI